MIGPGPKPKPKPKPQAPALDLDSLIAARQQALAPKGPSIPAAAPVDASHVDLDALIDQRMAAQRGAEFTPGQKFGTEVAQGATLGFAPKILGVLDAANSMLPTALGGQGKSFGEARNVYAGTRDRIMRADAEAQDDSKLGSLLTQAAGGGIVALPFAAVSAARAGVQPAAPILARTAKAMVTGAKVGAVAGGVSGIGHATGDLRDYATQGGLGALGGAALGGAAGAGTTAIGGVLRGSASKMADIINPERPVIRNAAGLVDDATGARLAEINRIAPGGGSLVTAAVPETGPTVARASRLGNMLRGVGASPEAASRAEMNLLEQGNALRGGLQRIGGKMGAIEGRIPATDAAQTAVQKAQEVIAKHAPTFQEGPTVAGVAQDGTPIVADGGYDIQDVRQALSRLKYMQRVVQRSTNPNGAQLHDVNEAIMGLQSLLYEHSPEFQALDRDYAIGKNAQQQNNAAIRTVRNSQRTYAANQAYNASSGSLGGSLPQGHQGMVSALLDRVMADRPGAADAVANIVTRPGGRELVAEVLNAAAGRPRLQLPPNLRLLQILSDAGIRPGVTSGAAGGVAGRRLLTP